MIAPAAGETDAKTWFGQPPAQLPYLRLRQRIANWILEGRFRDGDLLPSIRHLAQRVGHNPLTVAKAYHGLVDAGVITRRQGVGLFVAEGGAARLRQIQRAQFLQEEWPSIREEMERLGLDWQEMLRDALRPAPGTIQSK